MAVALWVRHHPAVPFSNYIFARHAYVKKNPGIHVICPACGEVCASRYDNRITDPPFFDHVHYSELADFFYVWQELYFNGSAKTTTRDEREVQDTVADAFAKKLKQVFKECHRVLRDDGLLVFSYHHSREDGWSAIAEAVLGAGFSFVQSQPVKAEMSVAAPKSQAKEPIDLDVLLVCRKKSGDKRHRFESHKALSLAADAAAHKVVRQTSRIRECQYCDS